MRQLPMAVVTFGDNGEPVRNIVERSEDLSNKLK